jgi:hypothetical protein
MTGLIYANRRRWSIENLPETPVAYRRTMIAIVATKPWVGNRGYETAV